MKKQFFIHLKNDLLSENGPIIYTSKPMQANRINKEVDRVMADLIKAVYYTPEYDSLCTYIKNIE